MNPPHPDDRRIDPMAKPTWTVGGVRALARFMEAHESGDGIRRATAAINLWETLYGQTADPDKPIGEVGEEVSIAIDLLKAD